jgi:hypothetical protein
MSVVLMDSRDNIPIPIPIPNPNLEGEGQSEGEEGYYLVKVEEEEKELKVIEWEEFEKELVRLWSLSSSWNKAKAKRDALLDKLNAILQWGCRIMYRCESNLFHGKMNWKQCRESLTHRRGEWEVLWCH